MNQYLYHNKGIYHCNNKSFFNKLEAILECNANPHSYVEWDYHETVFKQAQWSHEPPVLLEELYKQRALQLREAYDHVVVFFSGGVDSWYILNAFVKNNIQVDEIYMFGAFEAEEKHNANLGFDRSPGYYTREVRQAQDLVKRLALNKKTKINVYDWTRDIIDAANDRDWFWHAAVRHDPSCMVRSKFHKIFREHSEMCHRGKKVGFVYGIDKPRLVRDDQYIYFSFLDVLLTMGTVPTNDILGEYWENDEFFYWTPNMPELIIKQCHQTVNHLKSLNKLHLIKHMNDVGKWEANQTDYYREVNRAIFPDWNINTWQIKKPTGPVYNEMSRWFLEGQFEAKLKWESSLWELERLCGKKWFNENTVTRGLRGHISPFYKITSY